MIASDRYEPVWLPPYGPRPIPIDSVKYNFHNGTIPLMRAIVPREVSSYSYARAGYANPHAVTSVGGTTYTYDNNGNVTAIGSLDYTWDWRNRLASAERSGGGNHDLRLRPNRPTGLQSDGNGDHKLSE